MTAPESGGTPVSRAEFDLLCEIVEIILGTPGGVADQGHLLTAQSRNLLTAFGEMRHG